VEWHGNENGFFLNNVIERSGIHPGRGSRGNGTYIALNITGDTKEKENKFHRNTIDSTGYLGIDFRTGSTYIRNNFITNFCLIKEDGAGIYTWSNPHGNNVIEGNIIPGRLPHQMSRHDQKSYVHGIYIDDLSKNILVKDNTVAYCPASGIFIHNANHLELKGNTLVGNGDNIVNKEKAQLLIRRDNLAPDSEWDITNLVVNENKFFSLREDQYCIYLNSVKEINLQSIGSFSDNQYVATGAYQVAAQDSNPNSLALCQSRIEMDLKDWQSKFSKDKNSTFDIVRKSREVQNRKNLIKNGDMTANTGGWIVWSERSKAWITHHAKEGMEGPSLKVEINSDGKSDMLLYHGGFGLKRNMIYRLSFAAWSDSKCQIQFVPLMAVSPWKALGDYACFSLDTIRKEYVYYFIPSEENMEARLNFKSSSGFLIDEVILEEITPNVITGEEPITLYYNASSDSKTIRLNGSFMTSEKKPVGNSIVLPGYRTKVLLNQ
jgi:parallel beta-helix repeat protein